MAEVKMEFFPILCGEGCMRQGCWCSGDYDCEYFEEQRRYEKDGVLYIPDDGECAHCYICDEVHVIVKTARNLVWSPPDEYGHWELKIGRKQYDDSTCVLERLTVDGRVIWEQEYEKSPGN